ncbi:MAG: class I SAM-dependent rRNA methyltransferase [Chitinophagales bacterium]|nr:class I SAM-dependent rRNA methyltransferase [Chitinophagales bacterium]
MIQYKKIILKANKEASLERYHSWVFSGAIDLYDDTIIDGEVVEVFSSKNESLGVGHFSSAGSISVRMLAFKNQSIDADFYLQKFKDSIRLRKQIISIDTDCFRLIHGEGDGLPGLIIDVYFKHIVVQAHSLGMHLQRELIKDALIQCFPEVKTIFYKSETTLHAAKVTNEWLLGSESETLVKEHNVPFTVNWAEGQKTGFFLDQRDNRKLLGSLSKGKSVLNTFCYTGGFSSYAIEGGASHVVSIDISQKAIDMTEKNIALLKSKAKHSAICGDIFEYLKTAEEVFDIVVLDPPAFAKNLSAKHNAVQAYKRLNIAGMKKVKPGGFLFTFSCSQVIDKDLFAKTVYSAAIESKRNIRILKNLEQGGDHPVNIFHPEGQYLKGLLLFID